MADVPAAPRVIGAVHATLITVGAMIGSGIFSTPTEVARAAGSPGRALLVWGLAGAVSLLGALSMCELGAALPETGGLYVYLRRAFGAPSAFVFGWAMLVVLVPSSVGFFAGVTAAHLSRVIPLSQPALTLGVIALVGGVNVLGALPATGLQSATAVLKYMGLLAVGAAALLLAPAASSAVPTTSLPPSQTLLSAMVPALWAYDGWIDVTSVAGELKQPEKNVPRALVAGTLAVTAIYLTMVLGYQRALGFDGIIGAANGALGSALGDRIGGAGARGITALVAVSAFGGCVIGMLTGTRVIQAMSADGSFLRALGRTNRWGAPFVAIGLTTAMAVGYARSDAMEKLAEVFVVGAWPFYAFGAVATIVLRRTEPSLQRPFRTPLHPWTECVFVLAALGLVVSYAQSDPTSVLRSLGAVACGIPVYAVARALRR